MGGGGEVRLVWQWFGSDTHMLCGVNERGNGGMEPAAATTTTVGMWLHCQAPLCMINKHYRVISGQQTRGPVAPAGVLGFSDMLTRVLGVVVLGGDPLV